ncbi:MAG TPA: cytochrome c, partial [Actinobacteria bacterium]|nr:cytochrome c [Actinomycetota bacterium]
RCAGCHQSAGVGGALIYSVNAPSILDTHPIEIAAAVRGGPGDMPVFGPDALSDLELEQLVTYVRFLQDQGAPGGAPITGVGPVTEGAVIWLVGLLALVLMTRWIASRDE